MRSAFLLVLVAGCSAELGPVRCTSGDNCAPGSYCSAAAQCAEPARCQGSSEPTCAVQAPNGLAAVGEQHQISLAWNTVGGAASYGVRRALSSGGPYTDAGSSQVGGFLDSGLSSATSYFYVVYAVGPGGPGAASPEVASMTVPDAPARASAAGGAGSITITWDPVSGAAGYRISRAGADGVFKDLPDVGASPTSLVDGGLGNGATYSYMVRARDAGGIGPPSAVATATTNP